jgi:small subunit ribosomal protein S14
MSKKSILQRNLKKAILLKSNCCERSKLHYIRNNKNIALRKRFKIQLFLSSISRNSSKIRIRNRCFLSGRGRGVYRQFNLSRIWIRILASEGKLPGVTKSSW